jgi:hypothetical protein
VLIVSGPDGTRLVFFLHLELNYLQSPRGPKRDRGLSRYKGYNQSRVSMNSMISTWRS